MKYAIILTTACITGLSACDSPTPPSYSAQDVTRIYAGYDRVNGLPLTPTADLPAGHGTYNGHIDGAVSGDVDGAIVGDMRMEINFITNDIGGTIDNVNYVDEAGVPEQLLGGSLLIRGTQTNGSLSASATGNLTAVGDEHIRGSAATDLALSGDIRTDSRDGDAVAGTVVGTATGDFDMTLTNGAFYGIDD